jgi:hypothetical protein
MANDLSSPMGSRPYADGGKGGEHPGIKDGVALGAPSGSELMTPMQQRPVPVKTIPAPAGPVTFQVTEDVQSIEGRKGAFPTGTSIKA